MSTNDDDEVPPPFADASLKWTKNPETDCWEGRDATGEIISALCAPRFPLQPGDFGSDQPAATRRKLTDAALKKYMDRRRGVAV